MVVNTKIWSQELLRCNSKQDVASTGYGSHFHSNWSSLQVPWNGTMYFIDINMRNYKLMSENVLEGQEACMDVSFLSYVGGHVEHKGDGKAIRHHLRSTDFTKFVWLSLQGTYKLVTCNITKAERVDYPEIMQSMTLTENNNFIFCIYRCILLQVLLHISMCRFSNVTKLNMSCVISLHFFLLLLCIFQRHCSP